MYKAITVKANYFLRKGKGLDLRKMYFDMQMTKSHIKIPLSGFQGCLFKFIKTTGTLLK